MADFFTPPPDFPFVPAEPATPPPNFEDIGAGFWAGAAKTGAGMLNPNSWLNVLIRALTIGVGWLLTAALRIMAFVVGELNAITDTAGGAFGQLVSNTLQNLLGINVPPSTVNPAALGQDRSGAAAQLAQAVLGGLFSTQPTATGGGVPPNAHAADKLLATGVRLELNGWLESWFSDAISYHLLEKYGELKDGLQRVLGLGRMMRQAFAPPLKVFVHDPYLAALNQTYRPKAMDAATALRAFHRGELQRSDLSKFLGDQGYTEGEIDFHVEDSRKGAPLADIDYLLGRQLWTNDQAVAELVLQNWDQASATQIVSILNDKRTYKYRVEMAAVAEEHFVAGDIDEGTFESVVGTLNLSQEEQQWRLNVATFKRSTKVTHLSLGQIEQGITEGILNLNDLQTWGARVNMPADELAYLELMILYKLNAQSNTAKAKAAAAAAKATAAQQKATAAAAKAVQAKAEAADKGLSATQAETLVTDGLWTFDQLTAFLTNRGYGPDAIAAIVSLLHAKLGTAATNSAAATGIRSSAAAKGLPLAEVEKGVVAGILSIDDLRKWLTAHGYDDADSQVIVSLTQDALSSAQTKAAAKQAATAKAAAKDVSLPELERAVRLGLTTLDAYNTALRGAGFDAAAVSLLDGLLNAQIASDKATAAKKGTLAAAAGEKSASLPQLEAEVVAGIRPIAAYTAALGQLGYQPADQTELTQLLQLKVDQAKATAAKRTAAATALSARGISLPQAETAVKLGVVPIATYQALLKSAGFTPDAIDVLSHSLLAQVAKASKTQAAANTAAGTLATKGISLPDLERSIVAGIEPIARYTSTLQAAGYSAADADTLTQLLELKVEQAQQASAAHADAVGAATAKGISLGSEEAAVVAGDKTMENYDSLLTSLGYDAIDRATLEQLLQKKVDAAAAKAASG